VNSVGLPRIGRLSYGWNTATGAPLISWDGHAQVTHEFTPDYDDAGKEILKYDHNVSVTGLIATDCLGATNHEAAINYARQILSTPNLIFIMTGGGMGDIVVTGGLPGQPAILDANGAVLNQPDMNNGPLPSIVTIRPMGRHSAYVEWRVRFSTAACLTNVPLNLRVTSIRSTAGYSIDGNGLTSRSVNAVVKLWQTLDFTGAPPNGRYTINPDELRGAFVVTRPIGFRRVSQNYTIAEDRRSISISVVDSEIESRNPYPKDVLNADVRHRVNVTQTNLGQIRQTMGGTITCRQGAPLTPAFGLILALIQDRTAGGGIVTDFSFTEPIFGQNSVDFDVSWWIPPPKKNIGGGSVPDFTKLFEVTKLFSPAGLKVDGNFQPYTWDEWAGSAQVAAAQGNRGNAGMLFNGASNSGGLHRAGGCSTSYTSQILLDDISGIPSSVQPLLFGLENEEPEETASWNEYENKYTIERNQRILYAGYESDPEVDTITVPANKLQFPDFSPGGDRPADVILPQGMPDYCVLMAGFATRIGLEIPRPKLTSVGGAPATELNGKFICQQMGWALNLPIYGAAWRIKYKLPHSPGTVEAPSINAPITNYEA
jgi:hypothetical protein